MSRVDVAAAAWPVMSADLSQPVMLVNGQPVPIGGSDRMAGIVAVAANWASQWKRPIRVTVTTPGGDQVLVVDEDGHPEMEALVAPETKRRGLFGLARGKANTAKPQVTYPHPAPVPAARLGQPGVGVTPQVATQTQPAPPARLEPPAPPADDGGSDGDLGADEVYPVVEAMEATGQLPSVQTWPSTQPDGVFGELDGLFEVSGADERARRNDPRDAVARQFTRTHFMVVTGSKGGVGKTTTAAVVASAFGMWSGEHTALIDNNPTGTLASRLEVSRPGQATIVDVARDLAQVGDKASGLWLQGYMTYQPSGKFRSLVARTTPIERGSNGQAQLVAATLPIDTFNTVMELASQAFRVVVLDGGNNDADSQHTGALGVVDCVLVVTDWSGPACKAVATQLSTLRQLGRDDLVASAIVVGSGTPATRERKRNQKTLLAMCAEQGVQVVMLPRVPSLKDGAVILSRQPTFMQKAAAELACAIADRFEAAERWG